MNFPAFFPVSRSLARRLVRGDYVVHYENISFGEQRWIEIALNRTPLLDHRAGKFKLDRPVKPDRIDRHCIKIAGEPGAVSLLGRADF